MIRNRGECVAKEIAFLDFLMVVISKYPKWPKDSYCLVGSGLPQPRGSPECRRAERIHTGMGSDTRPVNHEAVLYVYISLPLLAPSFTATTLLSLTQPKATHCRKACMISRLHQHNIVPSLKLLKVRNSDDLWPCFPGVCNTYPLFSRKMSSQFPFTHPAECQCD